MSAPLLQVDNVSKRFKLGARSFWAVREVSLALSAGECVAVVGESGSGKTTLARMIVGLTGCTEGFISLHGSQSQEMAGTLRGRRELSRPVQMVFQDPRGSLDPLMRIADIVADPLEVLGWPRTQIRARVAEVLDAVGLSTDHAALRPTSCPAGSASASASPARSDLGRSSSSSTSRSPRSTCRSRVRSWRC